MSESADQNVTEDKPLEDSLAAGLAAGFGRHQGPPTPTPLGTCRFNSRKRKAKGADCETWFGRNRHGDPNPATAISLPARLPAVACAVLRGRDVDLGRDLAIKVLLEKHKNRPRSPNGPPGGQIGGQLQHPASCLSTTSAASATTFFDHEAGEGEDAGGHSRRTYRPDGRSTARVGHPAP